MILNSFIPLKDTRDSVCQLSQSKLLADADSRSTVERNIPIDVKIQLEQYTSLKYLRPGLGGPVIPSLGNKLVNRWEARALWRIQFFPALH